MLRQCIGPKQRDCVPKLPAIEFAINLARSESTGYAPFFLNTGRMPRSMIWEHASATEYPGVRAYAQKVKYAVMAAHDSVLAARVKQTRDANRKRRPAPFEKDDLVYVSTKNMSLPKGLARKLIPKFIGPYRILEGFGNNSFRIELPSDLKQRGIHNVFHSSLLRVHVPNDDRLFPGRLASQVAELDVQSDEWAIERFASHCGSGSQAVFEAVWKSGDHTWVPYESVSHLGAMAEYLSAMGVEKIADLPEGSGRPPSEDPQIFVGAMGFYKGKNEYKFPSRKGRRGPASTTHLPVPYLRKASQLRRIHNTPSQYSMSAITFGHKTATFEVHSLKLRLTNPTTGEVEVFPPALYDAFVHFDCVLRIKKTVPHDAVVPGGYNTFAERWHRDDPDCKFQFCTYDPTTRKVNIYGRNLDLKKILPAGGRNPASAPMASASPITTKGSALVGSGAPATSKEQALILAYGARQLERSLIYQNRREVDQTRSSRKNSHLSSSRTPSTPKPSPVKKKRVQSRCHSPNTPTRRPDREACVHISMGNPSPAGGLPHAREALPMLT